MQAIPDKTPVIGYWYDDQKTFNDIYEAILTFTAEVTAGTVVLQQVEPENRRQPIQYFKVARDAYVIFINLLCCRNLRHKNCRPRQNKCYPAMSLSRNFLKKQV